MPFRRRAGAPCDRGGGAAATGSTLPSRRRCHQRSGPGPGMDSNPYRRYAFFDVAPVKSKDMRVEVSAEGANKVDTVPLHNREVTCCMAGRGRVVFGDSQGYVYQLLPNFETSRFPAHDGGATHQVWQAADCDVLVSVGDDVGDAEGEISTYVVKCWSLERRDHQGRPVLRASFPAFGERILGDPCPVPPPPPSPPSSSFPPPSRRRG